MFNKTVLKEIEKSLSNEIRDNNNATLPQITYFDRFKFNEYQPVQGIFKIANS